MNTWELDEWEIVVVDSDRCYNNGFSAAFLQPVPGTETWRQKLIWVGLGHHCYSPWSVSIQHYAGWIANWVVV